jgi:hypothetical protein
MKKLFLQAEQFEGVVGQESQLSVHGSHLCATLFVKKPVRQNATHEPLAII